MPADPTVVLQIPSLHDPDLAPDGKHAASAFALWFPIEGGGAYGQLKDEMGQRVIDKITQLAPNFAASIIRHTTFTPRHMGTVFGAPDGDYCHGLLHPDQIRPNRAGAQRHCRPADTAQRTLFGQCQMPRRTWYHLHPGVTTRPIKGWWTQGAEWQLPANPAGLAAGQAVRRTHPGSPV